MKLKIDTLKTVPSEVYFPTNLWIRGVPSAVGPKLLDIWGKVYSSETYGEDTPFIIYGDTKL